MARSASLLMLSIAAVILASGIDEPCFGQEQVSATLFLTPVGIVPNTYVPANLIPPATGTSTITVQSTSNVSGTLNFTVSCCQDYLTGTTVTAPEGATFSFDPASVTLQAGNTATTSLHVATSGQASFGKFIATVQPALVGGIAMPTATIPFTVEPMNETLPPCPLLTGASPALDLLRLGYTPGAGPGPSPLDVVISHHNPPGPDAEAAIAIFFPLFQKAYNVNAPLEWIINSPGVTLAAGTSHITVQNQSKTDIGFAAYNSATCQYAVGSEREVVVGPGGSAQMFFTKAEATTIVLSKAVMVSGFPQWHLLGAFSEPAFWTVFSGRNMTFVGQGD